MAHRVKTTAAVRACGREFDVKAFCEKHKLLDRYRFAISTTYDGWISDLEHDAVDETIVVCLKRILEGLTWIEDELQATYELPAGWAQNEDNWERYRTAIAVRILQAYYESIDTA
jgi:hypothetical protein